MIRVDVPTSKYVVNAMALLAYSGDGTAVPSHNPSGGTIEIEVATKRIFVAAYADPIHSLTDELLNCRVLPQSGAFQLLLDKWHVERGATSSITEMAMCPSYL